MDLKSQLEARFGPASPAPAAPASKPSLPDRDPDAHLGTPWMSLLRAARAPGLDSVPPKPSIPAARQLTDKAAKALKAAGQERADRALVEARDDFLKKREKEAWGLIKSRFTDLDLPERAYRALKQGEVDPEKVWARLRKASPEELKPMGADRLRDHLTG